MSFEAVPCMIRSAQDGARQIIGIIIRPSSSQASQPSTSIQCPIPITSASKQPLVVAGSLKRSVTRADSLPKSLASSGQSGPSVLWPGSSSLPLPVIQGQPRVLSSSSIAFPSPKSSELSGASCNSKCLEGSSSTPDSGIQSVPATPPPLQTTDKEVEDEEEESYADMPRLVPVIHEPSTSSSNVWSVPPSLDEAAVVHASECENPGPPSISISSSMDPNEIAAQLLAMDSDTVRRVTSLMLQKAKEEKKKKSDSSGKGKAKEEVKEEQEEKNARNAKRIRRSPSISDVDKKKKTKEEDRKSDEEPRDEATVLLNYRLAVKRRLELKVEDMLEDTRVRLSNMSSRLEKKRGRPPSSASNHSNSNNRRHPFALISSYNDLTQTKFDIVKELEKKREEKARRLEEEKVQKYERMKKRRSNEKKEEKGTKRRRKDEGREKEEYIEINRNEYISIRPPSPLAPPLPCLCTRKACLSASDCLSRAVRVFCSPSSCSLSSCSNTLPLQSPLYLNKGLVKTKTPLKAHQFLCEVKGEVVSVREMVRRLSSPTSPSSPSSSSPPFHRSFALSPSLFIDCSRKGNISRFLRHSCQPNADLQLWQGRDTVHLCVFSRYPLSTDTEVKVDMSRFTVAPFSCNCSSRRCRRFIPSSSSIPLSSLPSPSPSPLFLYRNLRITRGPPTPSSSLLSILSSLIEYRLRSIDGFSTHFYASFFSRLRLAAKENDRLLFMSTLVDIEERADSMDSHALSCIHKTLTRLDEKVIEGEKEKKKQKKTERNAIMDTSYLDSAPPVGSYNADDCEGHEDEWSEDAVRCVCGVMDEDGTMVGCDKCGLWLHSDCVTLPPSDSSFICPLCVSKRSTPHGDVLLSPQPSIRLPGCEYYKALENYRGLQVRQNETVYVRKLTSDRHKKVIRSLEKGHTKKEKREKEEAEALVDLVHKDLPRSQLLVFRVERLFVTPQGYRFVFGFYYARPHETFCDGNRSFHPNEVFATPLYDTLPLDAVHGKCLVMEASLYCQGRPTYPHYKEEDVLVCEYQIDRTQRSFEKIKNVYSTNTNSYAFRKFERERTLQRYFTPFALPSSSNNHSSDSFDDASSSLKKYATRRIEQVAKRLSTSFQH